MVEIVGLISGGKDSIYNLIECVRNGHKIVALANLKPPKQIDELDSFMYQTVGNNLIEIIAKECLELPLYQIEIKGTAKSKESESYEFNGDQEDEVEDLFKLLSNVIKNHPTIKGVSCGAILSTYQRIRVENCCSRLGLTSYSYLWNRNQDQLLREMIQCNLNAVIIKVASMGLIPNKHLLLSIEKLYPILYQLNLKYGVHICGEGGEYESIVLDSPLYKKSIKIDNHSTIIHSDDAFSQVAYSSISSFSTINKTPEQLLEQSKFLNKDYIKRNQENIQSFLNENNQLLSSITQDDTTTTSTTPTIPVPVPTQSGIYNDEIRFNKNKLFFTISSSTTTTDGEGTTTGELLDKTLFKISNILNENSLSMDKLLYCNLYINDIKEFSNVNQAYYKYFKNNPASRACIQVSELPLNTKFIIDCIGIVEMKKSNLHVQSISNWAPACIGPYSQANLYNGFIFLAGQIAMIPSNLDLITSSTSSIIDQLQIEFQQILLNTKNLIQCLNIDFKNVIQSTIFISDKINSNLFNGIINYLNQFLNNTNRNDDDDDDDENSNNEDSNNNLIQLYKVPNLPKYSNIEIIFTLYKEPDNFKNQLQYDDDDDDDEDNDNKKNYDLLINQFKNNNIKISKSISFLNSQYFLKNSSSTSLSSYIKNLIIDLNLILNQSKKDEIIYIKFYYLGSSTSSIINELIQILKEESGSFDYYKLSSFIPVLEMYNNSDLSCEIFIN